MKNNKLLNTLLVFLIIYIIYLMRDFWLGIIIKLLCILKPFIIGFSLAYALNPFLRFMKSKKIPKIVGLFIIFTILISLITFIIINVLPVFTKELLNLFQGILEFTKDIDKRFNVDLTFVENTLMDIFNKISKDFTKFITNSSLNLVNTSINIISNLVISIVAFIYFIIDMDNIRYKVNKFIRRQNIKTYKLVREIDSASTNYFKGLFANIVISFIEYTLVFKLIGHPNYLLLGVIAAFCPLLPYVGGTAMNIVAIISASVINTKLLILSIVVAIVFPQIDGYLIQPKIYGRTNKVPPLLTIFAVFAGGVLGGIFGIIIALPITIILLTIYRMYDEEINNTINDIKENIKK